MTKVLVLLLLSFIASQVVDAWQEERFLREQRNRQAYNLYNSTYSPMRELFTNLVVQGLVVVIALAAFVAALPTLERVVYTLTRF